MPPSPPSSSGTRRRPALSPARPPERDVFLITPVRPAVNPKRAETPPDHRLLTDRLEDESNM
ncbi:hypothetical protein AAFF_G00134060 [Aldrovandia affinis]|uniref:Uncharacterized protein n=1 Tax=Aldrovandia affinis TaxID=143900 RepID=A0AAD7W9H1_9TELE|nr:hypothetical protein AAFF_G00134060 [Aldrovandia affinis]